MSAAWRYDRNSRIVSTSCTKDAFKGPARTQGVGVGLRRRLRHVSEHRDRKDDPPDRHAQKRQPRCDPAVGKAEPVRLQDPQQVDQEEDAAADISERVTRGRHPIHLVIGRDVGQQRIVEDEAAGDPDVSDDEEPFGKPPVARTNEDHGRGRGDADGHAAGRASASSPLRNRHRRRGWARRWR